MNDDGHLLRISQLGDEGWAKLELDCPGAPACRALWGEPDETWTQADE